MLLSKLVTLLILVPLLDLGAIFLTSHYIGLGWTIGSMVACGVLGAVLVRREGLKTWNALKYDISLGRLPESPLLDGVLVLLSGALLLTPGPLTDAAGLILLLPPVRNSVRFLVRRRVELMLLGGATRMISRVTVHPADREA